MELTLEEHWDSILIQCSSVHLKSLTTVEFFCTESWSCKKVVSKVVAYMMRKVCYRMSSCQNVCERFPSTHHGDRDDVQYEHQDDLRDDPDAWMKRTETENDSHFRG